MIEMRLWSLIIRDFLTVLTSHFFSSNASHNERTKEHISDSRENEHLGNNFFVCSEKLLIHIYHYFNRVGIVCVCVYIPRDDS